MRYAFRVRQGPKTLVRVSFNDLPVFREASRDFKDTARPADHLLVPGSNQLRLEVWLGPESLDTPEIQGIADVAVFEVETEKVLARIVWPEAAEAQGLPEIAPFRGEASFAIDEHHPAPAYAEALREEVPEAGTPPQREALARLHDSLVRQDSAAFMTENAFKLDENKRYYGATPDNDRNALTRAFERRFARKLEVAPLDDKQIRFEPRAESRVVFVSRRDGRPVIHATTVGDPGQSFALDPLFVKQAGVWTLLL